jgi:hypothetical protein
LRGDLEALRPRGFGASLAPGRSLYVEASVPSKLSRYEAGIERGFYKAPHELQRLQAARRAYGNLAPPAAIDVDVTGVSGEEH